MNRLSIAFALICMACGGAAGSSPAGSTMPESEGAAIAAPRQGSAGEGAACDFGGAERLTCAAGLTCCYPPSGEPESGRCASECAE